MIANRQLDRGARLSSSSDHGDGDSSQFQPIVPPVLMASTRGTRCAHCFGSGANLMLDGPPPQMRPLLHQFCSNRCMNACRDRAREEEMAAFQFVNRQSQQLQDHPSKVASIGPTALLLYRLICHMIKTDSDCLSDMESHIDELEGADDQDEKDFIRTTAMAAKGLFMCSRMATFAQNSSGIGSEVIDENYLLSAVSKIATNAFTVCDGEGSSLGFGLYLAAAVINHSCEPSLVQTFQYGGTENKPPSLLLTTCRSVADRDQLCIAYTDSRAPAKRRREILLTGYKFLCTCSRCENADSGDDDDDTVTNDTKQKRRDEAFAMVERTLARDKPAAPASGATDTSLSSPTLKELQEAYRSMKQCCATESYYVQEAGEALVQALLDRIAEAESEGQQRELCSKALAVLEELEEKKNDRCTELCPLPSLIRRYKIAKLQIFLVHDPRPALMMLQDVHSDLLVYFPRDHELIRDLEDCMRGGMS